MQNSRSLKKAFDCYLLESHTSDNKIGRPRSESPICLSRVWLQTELDDTKSYYQLIIKKLQFPRKEEYQFMKEREILHYKTDIRGEIV